MWINLGHPLNSAGGVVCCTAWEFGFMKNRLLVCGLALALGTPLACAAQENECGDAAHTIVQTAYPSAMRVSDNTYAVEQAVVALPGQGGLDPYAMVCRRWPANPKILLVAVPLLGDMQDDQRQGDLDILVLGLDGLRILARLRAADFISDDAIRLSGIAFDTARYQLLPDRVAFGLRASLEGGSKANPFLETTLWLYDFDGDGLELILDNVVVEKSGGEWDTNCSGEFWQTRRTLAMSPSTRNGAADIVVTTHEESSRSELRDGECEETETASTTSTDRLTFDGRSYVVPKSLKRAW